jgi:pimeloyl-ACP methyl ester carboxylesterase
MSLVHRLLRKPFFGRFEIPWEWPSDDEAAKGFWLKQGHAALFRGAGYNVFAFDANGFGESEPSTFDYPGDILSAGLWAQARTPSLREGLAGA